MQTLFEEKSSTSAQRQRAGTLNERCSEADSGDDWKKLDVECICPKCGKHHLMNIHWIGRGMPRKFCNSCRDSSSD